MTNLIQELLALNEEKFTAEKNLECVNTVLKFDGDIPLGMESGNQADKMGTEDGDTMFYVAIDPPHGNIESYVILHKDGKVSYYDDKNHCAVVKGKISRNNVSRDGEDEMDAVIDEYRFEGGKVAAGGIAAFLAVLEKEF